MATAYMVAFQLPETLDNNFQRLIPKQREIVNQYLAKGYLKSYSLSEDRRRLWAIFYADDEAHLRELLQAFPLLRYMRVRVTPLMFHQNSDMVMQFSLN